MTKEIQIKESITDKNSDFNVKFFKLNKLDIDSPTKVIDAKKVDYSFFKGIERDLKNIIFETSKAATPDTINNILRGTDANIKQAFGYLNWVSNYENVISITLEFNPFDEYRNIENDLSGFFDYYYQFSKTMLFVPNIRTIENIYKTTQKGTLQKIGERPLISYEEYLNFVDSAFRVLQYKNKKPIFVPISLKLDINEIRSLTKAYLKNEYFNFWIDFEGAATTNPTKLAKIRAFLREVDTQKRFDDIIIHSTNMRREITSNINKQESPSSDILTSLSGANFVGVNREPSFKPENPPPYEELQRIREHKARVFRAPSYYYEKIVGLKGANTQLLDQNVNATFNAVALNQEFSKQSTEFLKHSSIKEYICDKKMIIEYKDGELINTLFYDKTRPVQKTLEPWFVDV